MIFCWQIFLARLAITVFAFDILMCNIKHKLVFNYHQHKYLLVFILYEITGQHFGTRRGHLHAISLHEK